MFRKTLIAALIALGLPGLAAAQTGHHQSAGDRIGVTVEGSGKDVILIPGLGSNPRVWASTVKAVPGYRYHLVHVSGFSGRPAGANAQGDAVLEPVAHAIHEYIAANKLEKPAVIGHSMGGSIGMVLAAHHPESVGRLMVVDMLPFMGAMFGAQDEASAKPIADAMMTRIRSATPEAHKAFLEGMVAGMTNVASERPAILADSLASDMGVTGKAYHELIVTDLRPELAGITAPTTVLYVTPKGAPVTDAQMDGYYTASYAKLKGAKLVRVPDAAHFIMLDNPARFQSEVKAFLR